MRIGLFFGSFNPIHTGHLIIAQYMLQAGKLDRIKFIVSPHNPLKAQSDLMDAALRLKMVQLSIADNAAFEADDIEFNLPIPSYTCNTLEALSTIHPEDNFSIIMGSDNLEHIEKWKNFEFILTHQLLVYKRSNDVNHPFPSLKNITIFDSPILNISATTIRKMIEEKQSVKYLVRDEIISVLKKEL